MRSPPGSSFPVRSICTFTIVIPPTDKGGRHPEIDRKAFSDILSKGLNKVGGAMMPPPEGLWGMSPEFLETD